MKKSLIAIAIICLMAISLLTFLMQAAKMPNKNQNGFMRRWLINATIKEIKSHNFNIPLTQINGVGNSTIYFSSDDPRWSLVTDTLLNPIDTLFFDIQINPNLLSTKIEIDSPTVNLYASQISYLIVGNTTSNIVDTIHLKVPMFTRFARITPQILIVRGFDSSHQQQIFSKLDCTTGNVLEAKKIIDTQSYGGFSTDGFLHFDKPTNRIIYTLMFQNKIICLDSNLKLVYTSHTIDTVSSNIISLKALKDDTAIKLMPSTPRQIVNLGSETDNGYLYVLSALRSDNEDIVEFNTYTPIDVYQVLNGKYLGSFKIPNRNNEKVVRIYKRNKLLVALYKKGVVSTFQCINSL